MANYPPKIFFDDLTKRDNTKAPSADLYVAGFPCQPFSTAGLQQGFADARGRGEIFWHVRDYLEQKKPRVFVLENVSGLVKIKGGEYYRSILEALDALKMYNVYSKIMVFHKAADEFISLALVSATMMVPSASQTLWPGLALSCFWILQRVGKWCKAVCRQTAKVLHAPMCAERSRNFPQAGATRSKYHMWWTVTALATA